MVEETKPDAALNYLRKRFPRIAVAIAVLVAASAGLDWIVNSAEKIETVVGWVKPEREKLPYVEVVFDRSAAMNDVLGDGPETKWVAARQSLKHVELANRQYLALRTFGGPCKDDLGAPDIKFSADARGRLDATLDGMQPDGKGNLANAIIAAMQDFADVAKFSGTDKPRVVVITGSNDSCTGNPIEVIKRYQQRHPDIKLDFRFIGVQLVDAEKQVLAHIETATDGKVVYVNKREEIDHAVEKFLVLEPMTDSVHTMVDLLNACIGPLNKVMEDIKGTAIDSAEADFQVARDECKRSDQPFRELGGKMQQELGPKFTALYDRANQNRNLRERLIVVYEKLIADRKSGDVEGFNLALQEYVGVRDTYDAQLTELNSVYEQLKSQPDARP